jgi:hypothetical protein
MSMLLLLVFKFGLCQLLVCVYMLLVVFGLCMSMLLLLVFGLCQLLVCVYVYITSSV